LRKLIADSVKCTGCGVCEEICSKTYFKTADKEKSAIRVFQDDGRYRVEVCDQCGDCVKMCSAVALNRADNGVVRITDNKCVGCLMCVAECKRGYMRDHDDLPVPFKCVACGLCAKSCPSGALSVKES
jgi:Fe-S-cluster-containing hydrogenase component 2